MEKLLTINYFLIGVLNNKLGLPKGTLAEFHKVHKCSGYIVPTIRAPPHPMPKEKLLLSAHMDYRSLVSPCTQCSWHALPYICLSLVIPPQLIGWAASSSAWFQQVVVCQGVECLCSVPSLYICPHPCMCSPSSDTWSVALMMHSTSLAVASSAPTSTTLCKCFSCTSYSVFAHSSAHIAHPRRTKHSMSASPSSTSPS